MSTTLEASPQTEETRFVADSVVLIVRTEAKEVDPSPSETSIQRSFKMTRDKAEMMAHILNGQALEEDRLDHWYVVGHIAGGFTVFRAITPDGWSPETAFDMPPTYAEDLTNYEARREVRAYNKAATHSGSKSYRAIHAKPIRNPEQPAFGTVNDDVELHKEDGSKLAIERPMDDDDFASLEPCYQETIEAIRECFKGQREQPEFSMRLDMPFVLFPQQHAACMVDSSLSHQIAQAQHHANKACELVRILNSNCKDHGTHLSNPPYHMIGFDVSNEIELIIYNSMDEDEALARANSFIDTLQSAS